VELLVLYVGVLEDYLLELEYCWCWSLFSFKTSYFQDNKSHIWI